MTELGKQHAEQSLNLVLVARRFISQLAMQAHQLAIGGNQVAGHIASTGFSTEQHPGDGRRIQFVGLGSQSSSLGKLMRLSRMQEAQLVPAAFQKVVEILALARSGLQTNQDLRRGDA